ncbi:MAG: hypothetical protein ACP5JH_00980 [Bacteroidota bacterium]
MITKCKILAVSVLVISYNLLAFAQQPKDQISSSVKTVTNKSFGFSFKTAGEVVREDSATYSIKFSALSGLNGSTPYAYVSVSNEPFVYLPGSYGGRYFLNQNAQADLLIDRLLIDSITVNGLKFRREYWAVYAGMGAWEAVVNCYTLQKDRYYVISLVQDLQSGKPGEVINDKKLTKEEIQSSLLHMMQDATSSTIRQFNQILYSFSLLQCEKENPGGLE